MSPISKALGVSRTSLYASPQERGQQTRLGDDELVALIKPIVEEKPTFGYRRVTARLRNLGALINHKRIYRIMRREKLLLQRYAPRPERPHDGKVITLKSDLRWCTDAFVVAPVSTGHLQKGKSHVRNDHIQGASARPTAAVPTNQKSVKLTACVPAM